MSESKISTPEIPNISNETDRSESIEKNHHIEHHHESTTDYPEKSRHENLTAIRNEVSKEAESSKNVNTDETKENDKLSQPPINNELKTLMFSRTVNRIRKELKGSDKLLSKIVHTKMVDSVSSAGEKTIARPIGLLGGGACAFFGSLIALYIAKHYGFKYNMLLFFILFVLGYLVTTLIELIYKAIFSSNN